MEQAKNDFYDILSKITTLNADLSQANEGLRNQNKIFTDFDFKTIKRASEHETLKLNLRGKSYDIQTKKLLNFKDNLFYFILNDPRFDLNEEVFIDRENDHFDLICDYINGDNITERYKRLCDSEKNNLLDECYYYELTDIINFLKLL